MIDLLQTIILEVLMSIRLTRGMEWAALIIVLAWATYFYPYIVTTILVKLGILSHVHDQRKKKKPK